jgi:DNA-binding transcriptional LysR family regulator
MAHARYTLRQLDAFCQVADTLSFTAAGARVGLTPSAVSQLVSELELAVGFRLFERSTRRVELTAAGREFLGSAESVLKHLNLAERAAADVRNRSAGLVRVAAPMVIASLLLPHAIRAYLRTRPEVSVRIRDASVEQLAGSVASGDADLAIGPDRITADDVARTPVFDSPWVLWCAATHPLARRRQVRWTDLRGQALVAAGRDHERSLAHMRIAATGEEPILPVDVVDNISTALGIAAAGLAATLSPAYVRHWAQRLGLVQRPLTEPTVQRTVSLYRPVYRALSPAAEGFAAHLEPWMRQFNAGAQGRRATARTG